ncbi:hypothetical protein GH733_010374 [Mirounga leonina]|nr:hypothetical protein GH733_010374 [Mirounga leonina]
MKGAGRFGRYLNETQMWSRREPPGTGAGRVRECGCALDLRGGSSCKRRSWARPRLPRSPPDRADWKGGARTTRRRCAAAPLHAWAGRGPGPAPTA